MPKLITVIAFVGTGLGGLLGGVVPTYFWQSSKMNKLVQWGVDNNALQEGDPVEGAADQALKKLPESFKDAVKAAVTKAKTATPKSPKHV